MAQFALCTIVFNMINDIIKSPRCNNVFNAFTIFRESQAIQGDRILLLQNQLLVADIMMLFKFLVLPSQQFKFLMPNLSRFIMNNKIGDNFSHCSNKISGSFGKTTLNPPKKRKEGKEQLKSKPQVIHQYFCHFFLMRFHRQVTQTFWYSKD